MLVEPSLNLRASDAPGAIVCPGSVHPPPDRLLIDSVNEAALTGTVTHEILRQYINNGQVPENWRQICRSYGIEKEGTGEVIALVYAGVAFWEKYKDKVPNPQTEIEYVVELANRPGVTLSGHKDVGSVQGNHAITFDWKTTRLDLDYTAQLQFYAWLDMLYHPEVEIATTGVIFLRDRTNVIDVWTRDVIEDFGRRYETEVIDWDGRTYTPGGHCGYCRRFSNCEAPPEMIRATIAGLETHVTNDALIPFPDPIAMYERVNAVAGLCEKFKKHMKATILAAGGEITGPDGRRMVLQSENRDEIDPLLGWPIMSRELDNAELADVIKVRKGAFLDAVASKAPRGEKGKKKKEVLDDLKDAGAMVAKEVLITRIKQPSVKEIPIDTGGSD